MTYLNKIGREEIIKRYILIKIINFLAGKKNIPITKISKHLDITYSTTIHCIKALDRLNVVSRIKKGREIHINLTKYGLKISELLRELTYLLKK